MDIRSLLSQVASSYDRNHTLRYDQPAQLLLTECSKILSNYAPLGYIIGASGQKPFPLTFTPWIGFLDADESTTFQQGIYVVYLFSEDLKSVYLSLNQGTEKLVKKLKMKSADQLTHLQNTASKIRGEFSNSEKVGTSASIDLRHKGGRPETYQAGNIVSIEYDTANLPPLKNLENDLSRFISLYQRALQVRENLLVNGGLENLGMEIDHNKVEDAGLSGFNPKDDTDYVAIISAKKLIKSRKHETLVKKFGEHAKSCGFTASTPHPIDLVLEKNGITWIVEAKIVYNLNLVEAARGAMAQLIEYQHFLRPAARKVALLDMPIGGAYINLLRTLGIDFVTLVDDKWQVTSLDTDLLTLKS